jgi:hypothetical protein
MKNLLVQLQYKREEDFWTEAFAHLLEHLMTFDYKVAQQLLLRISKGIFDLSRYDSSDIKIETQNHVKQGITDIEITAPDFGVVIENKVEANLGYRQIEKYKDHLKNNKTKFLIIVLSKYTIQLENQEEAISLRWFEVHQYLTEINQDQLSVESCFLLNQFLGFLQAKGQSFGDTKVELAKSIAFLVHQQKLGFHKQVKSFETLQATPELKPLYDFLTLAEKAIKYVRPMTKVKLGSGESGHTGSAWIALNFDNGDVFFSLYFNKPNEIALETCGRKIDIEKMTAINNGEIFWYPWHPNKVPGWRRILELETISFFSESKSKQERLMILETFFRDFYAELGE